MSAEYEHEHTEEPRDYTTYVWGGIIGLFILMVLAIVLVQQISPLVAQGNISRVRASHILIAYPAGDPIERERAYDTVIELRERIAEGESFSTLASQYSDDPISARRGGDLGWARRGEYAPAFEETVWSLPVGHLSRVVETSFGYHLILVRDRFIAPGDTATRMLSEGETGE